MLADTALELTYKMRDAIQAGDLEQAKSVAQERMACLEALSKDRSRHDIAQRLIEADAALQQAASMEREKLRAALLAGSISPKAGAIQPGARFLDKAA